MKGERTGYHCRDCGRWMVTSAWSRYATHRLCRICYARESARWHDTLRKIAGEQGRPEPPRELPDW